MCRLSCELWCFVFINVHMTLNMHTKTRTHIVTNTQQQHAVYECRLLYKHRWIRNSIDLNVDWKTWCVFEGNISKPKIYWLFSNGNETHIKFRETVVWVERVLGPQFVMVILGRKSEGAKKKKKKWWQKSDGIAASTAIHSLNGSWEWYGKIVSPLGGGDLIEIQLVLFAKRNEFSQRFPSIFP